MRFLQRVCQSPRRSTYQRKNGIAHARRKSSSSSSANATYQTLEPRQLLATLSSFSILSHGETLGYIASDETTISSGVTETYTVNLRAQQHLSVRVVGNDALTPMISVSDPGGVNLGTDGSGASAATLQSLPVDTAGDYVISVSGFSSTVGDFEIEVLINATFESEIGDGNANETLETAEPIIGWVDPGSYLASPVETDSEIATIYGSFIDEGIVTSDDFETGSLDSRWATSSSTANGNIQVTNAFGSNSGDYSLVMSSEVDGIDNLNEAILDLGFAGIVPFLSFSYTQWNDEIDVLPDTFTGSVNGDGVSISDDGVQWHTIYNATPVINGEWGEANINLYQAALAADLDRNNLLVKFQQFGDSALLNDGRAFDNIRSSDLYPESNNFSGIPIAYDWYSFEVTEEQSISIASRRTNARRLIDNQVPGPRADWLSRTRIALLDANGEILEDTNGFENRSESYHYDSRIDNYLAAPGTYYVRVDGAGFEEYALSLTRGLALPYPFSSSAGDFISSVSVGDSIVLENEFWDNNEDISTWFGYTLQESINGGPIYHVNTNGAFQPSTGDGVYASALDSPEGFQEGVNELRADFNNPVRKVMIDVVSDDAGDSAFLRAYSATGVLLEEVTSGLIPHSNFETLVIDRPTAEIAYIIAAGTDGDPTPLDQLEFFEVEIEAKDTVIDAVAGETIIISLATANALPSNPDLSGVVEIQLWDDGNLLSTGTDSVIYVAPTTGSESSAQLRKHSADSICMRK